MAMEIQLQIVNILKSIPDYKALLQKHFFDYE